MFEAIIFDFDGVILDSEPIHFKACVDTLHQIGHQLTYDEYTTHYIGLADKEMFPKIFNNKCVDLSLIEINSLIKTKIDRYVEVISNQHLPIITGLEKFLAAAHSTLGSLAICSGSTRKEIMATLNNKHTFLRESFFKTIITSEDVEAGKPSPEGYLLTAARLGVNPEKCLVIEDSPYGIAAAKSAGMKVIGLRTTHDEVELRQADRVVNNYEDLLLSSLIGGI
jgi:beta-phosphoglucomutase